MKLKDYFFEQGSFTLGNAVNAHFWEDTWLGNSPLAHQYPSLYNIAQKKSFGCRCYDPNTTKHRFQAGVDG
jgi:hypothetical protein